MNVDNMKLELSERLELEKELHELELLDEMLDDMLHTIHPIDCKYRFNLPTKLESKYRYSRRNNRDIKTKYCDYHNSLEYCEYLENKLIQCINYEPKSN